MNTRARHVLDVTMDHVEVSMQGKRKKYNYVGYVTWSDNTASIIHRSYKQFVALQKSIKKRQCSFNTGGCPLPKLPCNHFLKKVRKLKSAEKRLWNISEFCKCLLSQPNSTQDKDICNFFRPTAEDIMFSRKKSKKKSNAGISQPLSSEAYKAIADYNKCHWDEVSLKEGDSVDVLLKTETGWWLVKTETSDGWAPAPYLEREGSKGKHEVDVVKFKTGKEEIYLARSDYSPQFDDEIKLEAGTLVQVMQKSYDGWWTVRCGGKDGLVPASCIEPANPGKASAALSLALPDNQITEDLKRKLSCGPNGHDIDQPLPRRRSIRQTKSKKQDRPALEPLKMTSCDADEGDGRSRSEESTTSTDSGISDQDSKDSSPASEYEDKSLDSFSDSNSTSSVVSCPVPVKGGDRPVYMARSAFAAGEENEISMDKGELVFVIEKTTTGWWHVETSVGTGYVPSHYLRVPNEMFTGKGKVTPSVANKSPSTANSSSSSLNSTQQKENISHCWRRSSAPAVCVSGHSLGSKSSQLQDISEMQNNTDFKRGEKLKGSVKDMIKMFNN